MEIEEMTTTYLAHFNGKIVGQRKSPRPYAFAIVGHYDEEANRQRAYDWQPTKQDRANYDYYARNASTPAEEAMAASQYRNLGVEHFQRYRDKAIPVVEGGWEGYCARRKAESIEWFERRKKAGDFEPHAIAWSMSAHNAQKAAVQHAKGTMVIDAIVPAVVKPARQKA